MKLVVLLPRFPYPLEKGDKLRAYHQLAALSKYYQIHLICLTYGSMLQTDRQQVEPYCESISIVKLNKITLPFRLLFYSIVRQWPAQVAYYFSPFAYKQIQSLLDKIQPDALLAQLVRTLPYCAKRNEYKVLDLMDAFSYGMAQRVLTTSGLTKWFYRRESRLLEAYEQRYAGNFDALTMISKQDIVRVPHLSKFDIKVLPNGIDLSQFRHIGESPQYDVVFVGNMGYQPNIEAAHYIVEQILPLYLEKYQRQLRVLIAGARPSHNVLKLASENVTISGFIDDINQAYSDGKVFVAPIFHGIGQQNKVMEAMACAIPCIVTAEVAAPFNAQDGHELLIANDVLQFVNGINAVLDDKIDLPLMLQNANKNICQKYSWEMQTVPLKQILDNQE